GGIEYGTAPDAVPACIRTCLERRDHTWFELRRHLSGCRVATRALISAARRLLRGPFLVLAAGPGAGGSLIREPFHALDRDRLRCSIDDTRYLHVIAEVLRRRGVLSHFQRFFSLLAEKDGVVALVDAFLGADRVARSDISLGNSGGRALFTGKPASQLDRCRP